MSGAFSLRALRPLKVFAEDMAAGEEPFYSFDAAVIRAFFSFWL